MTSTCWLDAILPLQAEHESNFFKIIHSLNTKVLKITYHVCQPPRSNFTYRFTSNFISLISERFFLSLLRQRRPGGQTKISASHSDCGWSSQRQKGFWQTWLMSVWLSEAALTICCLVFVCATFSSQMKKSESVQSNGQTKAKAPTSQLLEAKNDKVGWRCYVLCSWKSWRSFLATQQYILITRILILNTVQKYHSKHQS